MKTLPWIILLAIAGWFGYNYFVVAPRQLDESFAEAAAALPGSETVTPGDGKMAACLKEKITATLPSLYGFPVLSRLALRDAAFGALGDAPTDVYWAYAIQNDLGGQSQSANDLFAAAFAKAGEECAADQAGG